MSETQPLTWQQRQATRAMAEVVAASPRVIDVTKSIRRIGESAMAGRRLAGANRRLLDGIAARAFTRSITSQQRLAQGVMAPALTRFTSQQRLAQGVMAPALTRFTSQQRLAQGLTVGGPARACGLLGAGFLGRSALPAVEQIGQVLWRLGRAWDHSVLPIVGRTLARVPLLAALAARRAALQGDWETVRAFVQHWLDRRPTVPILEAAVEALLDDGWLPESEVLEPVEVIAHLRARTSPEHARRYKWIGDTQIAGRRIDSLDRPVPLPSGDLVALVEVTPAPLGLQHDDSINPRLARALPMLKPEEQQVLLAWEPGMTWQQAADACGLPSSFGERVRRKRGRVAAEVQRRLA